MYRIVQSLNCALETNVTLYVNYTSIKSDKNKKVFQYSLKFEGNANSL